MIKISKVGFKRREVSLKNSEWMEPKVLEKTKRKLKPLRHDIARMLTRVNEMEKEK